VPKLPERRIATAEWIGLALVIAAVTLPLLATGARLSLDHDWLTHLMHHRFARGALLAGELPAWSPWVAGGYPMAGHPEAPFPSPLVLPTLLLGEGLGLKVNAALFLAAGALGTHRLARERCGPEGALTAAGLVAGASWFTWCLADGNYVELHMLLFPAILAGLRAGGRGLALAAGLTSLIVFDGNVALLSVGLMLALATLALPGARLTLGVARLAAVMAGAAALAMGKLAPMLGLLARDSRGLDDYADAADVFYTAGGLLTSLVTARPAVGPYPMSRVHLGGLALGLALAGAAIGLAAGPGGRRGWAARRWAGGWALIAVVSGWLSMGPAAPVDLFKVLWRLPLYHSMRHPAKAYDAFLVIALALLAGLAVDALARRLSGRRWLAGGLGALAVVAAGWRAPGILVGVFSEPPLTPAVAEFHQVQGQGMGRYEGRPIEAEAYYTLLRGVGLIDWKQNILWESSARPRYLIGPGGQQAAAAGYPGEAWLVSGEGEILSVTPSASGIAVSIRTAGDAVLAVNQNADPALTPSEGAAVGEGSLAVALEGAGEREVIWRYRPPWWMLGLVIQGLSWLGLLGVIGALSRGPRAGSPRSGRGPTTAPAAGSSG